MQRIRAFKEYVGKVKEQLLRRLKAYAKDQTVKGKQTQEKQTQDRRAAQEEAIRRDRELGRVERVMAVSGQLIQDAVDRLLPPPDAAPLWSLSDMDEDKADSGSQTDASNEQERVERTLAASSQLIQDAVDRLQAAPDAAPRKAYPDMDENEAADEGENKSSDSDSERPGGHEGDNSQGDVVTSDSDPEE